MRDIDALQWQLLPRSSTYPRRTRRHSSPRLRHREFSAPIAWTARRPIIRASQPRSCTRVIENASPVLVMKGPNSASAQRTLPQLPAFSPPAFRSPRPRNPSGLILSRYPQPRHAVSPNDDLQLLSAFAGLLPSPSKMPANSRAWTTKTRLRAEVQLQHRYDRPRPAHAPVYSIHRTRRAGPIPQF